jgi:hypothetical protein
MSGGVGSGVLQGGWEFVIAAYSVSACVFLAYFLSVHLRYRAERRQAEREAAVSRSSHE